MANEVFSQDKLLSHLDKLNNWVNGNLETVVNAEVDLTNECNSRCPRCSGCRNSESELNLQQIKSLILQLKDIKARAIVFTGGGEPALNKRLGEAIRFAHDSGLSIGVNTNGIELSDELAGYITSYADWCRVSIDAGTSEMYAATHGLGEKEFLRVIENTKKLVEIKKHEKSKCDIGVAYLTGKDTMSGILDFVRLSREIGVDYAWLRPFHFDSIPVSDEIRAEAKKQETDKFKVFFSWKYEQLAESERAYDRCLGANFVVFVASDYKVYACCHTKGIEDYAIGDLSKQSLREILGSERRREVLNGINTSSCLPLCRLDNLNRILWQIKQAREGPGVHSNFM